MFVGCRAFELLLWLSSAQNTMLCGENSIRHNLSLHSRFIRVQNEGTGKSSWWMLNPEGGKSGKSPRRRAASMDNNSKFAKSRGRAAKKKQVSLQGGVDGGADSPGSQYSKWPGSPNSHSNDDFDAWTAFRPRTSSNASTLSGRLSPFMPEQEDLGDDVHLVYPGSSGSKMTATLPSLSEMAGHHSSENVMENLLDNLNLLPPKNSQIGVGGAGNGSTQSSPSSMMQASPGYPAYSSPSMGSQPTQDYRKCLYGQAGMNTLSPIPMQTLPESKPSFSPFMSQYNCPAGLLKELLTTDADPNGELMPAVETVVSQSGGGCMLPTYNSQAQAGHGGKMMSQHSRPLPHSVHGQATPTSVGMNGRTLLPLTSMNHSGVPGRLATVKSHMPVPHGHQAHLGGGALTSYCSLNSNGYGRPGPPLPHHPEKLPSDLDGMPVERFECDVESILHDTLMDGDSLDFNFDPTLTPQGFPHGVKTTTHSWVSG
ncbi:hypothetical protein JZ751_022964 [Albula glossodonta]|uniref:Fork-head domain-containing protein n=1 Tax=Albula glossodonta TaxID=121402 RepID=A0A8T2PEE4_9TELE|nr:hypothetical protein JZ751_011467 [Albula glossodonta]KAG9351713.1 hypothetical protein JZ751_022964 [Albula glossodonta]